VSEISLPRGGLCLTNRDGVGVHRHSSSTVDLFSPRHSREDVHSRTSLLTQVSNKGKGREYLILCLSMGKIITGVAYIVKGSHSFACHPCIYPLMEFPYLPLPSQLKLVLLIFDSRGIEG